ncbi:MAG: hypothetical protein AB7O44_29935 [Hyphomicrobiaceae bacterium]
MPRYFLHVQSSSDILEDPVGQDFDDLAAAEREAAAAACELMAEALRWGKPLGLQRKMLINDAAGRTVSTVPFAAALPGDPAPTKEPSIAALIQRGSNFTRNWRPG